MNRPTRVVLALTLVAAVVGIAVAVSAPASVRYDNADTVALAGCVAPPRYSRAPRAPFDGIDMSPVLSDAAIYREACWHARRYGPKQYAIEYRRTSRLAICRAYARAVYPRVFSRPAIDGCLKGFRLSRGPGASSLPGPP
jgi:hypothetical protein